jgi:hypothetical protein
VQESTSYLEGLIPSNKWSPGVVKSRMASNELRTRNREAWQTGGRLLEMQLATMENNSRLTIAMEE